MTDAIKKQVAEICKTPLKKLDNGDWAGFRYQILNRLQGDCDYFLGNGNRKEGELWAGTVTDHLEAMEAIYKSFSPAQRPLWLTAEQLQEYKFKMLSN